MKIPHPEKSLLLSIIAAVAMLTAAGCGKQKTDSAAPASTPPVSESKPASAPTVPDLTMPNVIPGKWKKQGGTGWHVFESPTLHYWTDGKKRNDHRISIQEKNGAWYIYWADIERPPERVEITQKDGKIMMRTIPTSRGGVFGPHFSDETFVKE